jgi:hypothetical protein
VAFRTRDPSKVEELWRRSAEIAEALTAVHPAVTRYGELAQHVPTPKPEVRELPSTDGNGVELIFHPKPEAKQTLLNNLWDHEAMWQRGECPIMTDESVRAAETKGWARVDR